MGRKGVKSIYRGVADRYYYVNIHLPPVLLVCEVGAIEKKVAAQTDESIAV